MSSAGSASGRKLSRAALERHAREWPGSADTVARMLDLLGSAREPFSRSSVEPGHFTASGFVLCPERRRVLLVHHRKLDRWLQPGGHVDADDADLEAAARREVAEETGVAVGAALGGGIFDVDVHEIPASVELDAHLHFDVRHVFVASQAALHGSPEVLGVRWVELDAVGELTNEDSVLRCVRRLPSAL